MQTDAEDVHSEQHPPRGVSERDEQLTERYGDRPNDRSALTRSRFLDLA
jgi:hypothetical protein